MAAKRGLNTARGLGALIPQAQGAPQKEEPVEKENVSSPAKKTPAKKTGAKSGSAKKDSTARAASPKKTTAAAKATAKAAAPKKTAAKTAAPKKTAAKAAVPKKAAEAKAAESGKATAANKPAEAAPVMLRIADIVPNKEQPRTNFEEEALRELAESIRLFGVIQPLLVQPKGAFYELIAGERRWRAARMAGLKEVPVVIRTFSNQQAVEISLIENIQREDLNAIEEAQAYQRLMDEFRLTQEEVAARVTKSRSAVANALRLLALDGEVQDLLVAGTLSAGHARALLALESGALQAETAQLIVRDQLSVRETEQLIKRILNPRKTAQREEDPQLSAVYQDLQNLLRERMGTRVTIQRKRGNKGKIEIEYYSQDDLERILSMIR